MYSVAHFHTDRQAGSTLGWKWKQGIPFKVSGISMTQGAAWLLERINDWHLVYCRRYEGHDVVNGSSIKYICDVTFHPGFVASVWWQVPVYQFGQPVIYSQFLEGKRDEFIYTMTILSIMIYNHIIFLKRVNNCKLLENWRKS